MILNRIIFESTTKLRLQYFSPSIILWSHTGMPSGNKLCHTTLCPASKSKNENKDYCPTKYKSYKGSDDGPKLLKRRKYSGKVRMGFIPEEFFEYLHPKTGVTGPYLLMLTVANYLISKEIYVMEHEYYLGLSILCVVIYVTKKFGKIIGASLDKQVDAVASEWQGGRDNEIKMYKDYKKASKTAIWRAEGQKYLMDAKKENVQMQLEAEYRNRAMHVYYMVRGRMDYHIKTYQTCSRIQQKWMIEWILKHVMKSITPEFEKRALEAAIRDLSTAASRY